MHTDHAVLVVREPDFLTYRSRVRAASTSMQNAVEVLGKTVVLHRTRDVQSAAYIGTAVVYYVLPHVFPGSVTIELENIRPFLQPVPLAIEGMPLEGSLKGRGGRISFQRMAPGLRTLSQADFAAIVNIGFGASEFDTPEQTAFEPSTSFEHPAFTLVRRRTRRRLHKQALHIYHARCLVTGTDMTMPEGISLLEVSHYQPLGHGGPDELSNVGLKTPDVHSFYENGLLAIWPDGELLVAPDCPDSMRGILQDRKRAFFPTDPSHRPKAEYLDYHRHHIFEKRLRSLR